MTTVTVYDLCYSQNVCGHYVPAEAGPSIATMWNEDEARAIAARAGDLVVVPVEMDEDEAFSVAE